jgi:hypothetical protein
MKKRQNIFVTRPLLNNPQFLEFMLMRYCSDVLTGRDSPQFLEFMLMRYCSDVLTRRDSPQFLEFMLMRYCSDVLTGRAFHWAQCLQSTNCGLTEQICEP